MSKLEDKIILPKEALIRYITLFPEDFMFEMTKKEFSNWVSQIATPNFIFIT